MRKILSLASEVRQFTKGVLVDPLSLRKKNLVVPFVSHHFTPLFVLPFTQRPYSYEKPATQHPRKTTDLRERVRTVVLSGLTTVIKFCR